MVRLINYKLLTLLVSLITLQGFAQTTLYVSSGTNFYITTGTDVYIDGIVIRPSINYNITGENSVTKDVTATPPPPATYIQRVYHLFQTLNGFSGDITIYYKDAELNGLMENSLNLYVYDGATWNVYLPTSRDEVNNYITTSGLVNIALNEVTLTNNADGAALPITLTGFTAQRNRCVANLKWTTATEQNSKHFEVQHSTDGVRFTTVGVVPSSGNSNIEKHYNFSINLNNQNNFFRLQMVDFDGSSKFSPTLSVTTNCSSNIITLFPNPTRNTVTITGLSGDNQLRLLDNLGQVLKIIKTTNHTETINVSTLPSGTYVIQIVQKNEVIKNIKVIKE
jgi:hypothetical protein